MTIHASNLSFTYAGAGARRVWAPLDDEPAPVEPDAQDPASAPVEDTAERAPPRTGPGK